MEEVEVGLKREVKKRKRGMMMIKKRRKKSIAHRDTSKLAESNMNGILPFELQGEIVLQGIGGHDQMLHERGVPSAV